MKKELDFIDRLIEGDEETDIEKDIDFILGSYDEIQEEFGQAREMMLRAAAYIRNETEAYKKIKGNLRFYKTKGLLNTYELEKNILKRRLFYTK